MTPGTLPRGASGASRRAAALLLVVTAFLAACSRQPASLTSTFESDEAAARAVLDAMARRDEAALRAMAVTKDEFDDLVWPTLPVSRPEVGMPRDYVWEDTASKSRGYLAQTLAEFGGQRFELVNIEFRGETTDHGAYSVSRKSYLTVKDGDGRERTIRLFGSMIRQNGRSKVYSYIID